MGDKGQCLFYPEQYSLSHRCKKPQLLMIEALIEEPEEQVDGNETDIIEEDEAHDPPVTMYALTGSLCSRTMRLEWKIGG
ncbi:hypothetical protein FF1_031741 [Malus domestica]